VEEADGVCFLTMEYVDGALHSHRLEREGLPLARLLDWSVAIAEALVAAHRAGVVHRDLKLDNVMVTADGRIKVLDFGLAKLRDPADERSTSVHATASITEEGKILGLSLTSWRPSSSLKPARHASRTPSSPARRPTPRTSRSSATSLVSPTSTAVEGCSLGEADGRGILDVKLKRSTAARLSRFLTPEQVPRGSAITLLILVV
jgi:serine/threonine protein kinase